MYDCILCGIRSIKEGCDLDEHRRQYSSLSKEDVQKSFAEFSLSIESYLVNRSFN